MNHETGNYYTLGHLSQITGLTDRTLRTYLKNGILEGEKISGIWHFTAAQLDAFLRHPTVRPSILAKNNAIVYDFMLDTKKNENRVCIILDLPNLDRVEASRFFCEAICYGDYRDLRFSLDAIDSPPHHPLRSHGPDPKSRQFLQIYAIKTYKVPKSRTFPHFPLAFRVNRLYHFFLRTKGVDHMQPRTLLDILTVAERLKDTTRHCYTSKGRHESVAEHSWMAALMAFFLRDEFPEADMDKVIRMCIIHDLGECFTGDIPTFDKTAAHEEAEEDLLTTWVKTLPQPYREEMTALYAEMNARETLEAKIYKAIDNLEAVVQHNLSDISTWIPHEYQLNQTYGADKAAFSPYLTALREEMKKDTLEKIKEA